MSLHKLLVALQTLLNASQEHQHKVLKLSKYFSFLAKTSHLSKIINDLMHKN